MTPVSPAILPEGSLRRIWLSSDFHLGQQSILNFVHPDGSGRRLRHQFDTLDQMHDCIITRHNERVKQGDRYYNLGDLSKNMAVDEVRKILLKMNGRKSFIIGNHDDPAFIGELKIFRKVQLFRRITEVGLMLSHAPMHPMSTMYGGYPLLNVHGHIHAHKAPDGPYVNISVEATDYAPIDLDELIAIRERMPGPSAIELFNANRRKKIKEAPVDE